MKKGGGNVRLANEGAYEDALLRAVSYGVNCTSTIRLVRISNAPRKSCGLSFNFNSIYSTWDIIDSEKERRHPEGPRK